MAHAGQGTRNPQDTTLRNLNATKRRLVALEQDVNIEKARGGDAPQRARRADCVAGAIRREPHPCGRSDDTPQAVGLSVSRRHGELSAFQDWGAGWWLA